MGRRAAYCNAVSVEHANPTSTTVDEIPGPCGNDDVFGSSPQLNYVSHSHIFLTLSESILMMPSLTKRIVEYAATLPEGAPICAGNLLHVGKRAAVDQSLSRLARKGRLMRVYQGVYVRPIETRFGMRPPVLKNVIGSLAVLWGETIVRSGSAAANMFGLTTQIPITPVYLTSGTHRHLRLGALTVQLRYAPRWQLIGADRPAGNAVRALAWLGPREIKEGLQVVAAQLSSEDLEELAAARAIMPTWIAEPISALVASD